MTAQPYKVLLKRRNETMLPTEFTDRYTGEIIKPGDLIVLTCSRVHADAILPAIYLGKDPKDGTKLKYLTIPRSYALKSDLEEYFQILTSKTAIHLKLNWEVFNTPLNVVIFKIIQEILNKSHHIELDKIINSN